ncbi:unnamed protein product [Ixodes hexagonus]
MDSSLRLYNGEQHKGLTEFVESIQKNIEASEAQQNLPLPDDDIEVRSSKGMAALGVLQNEDHDEDGLFRTSEDDLLAAQSGTYHYEDNSLHGYFATDRNLERSQVSETANAIPCNDVTSTQHKAADKYNIIPVRRSKDYQEYSCSELTDSLPLSEPAGPTADSATVQRTVEDSIPSNLISRRSIAEIIEEIVQHHITASAAQGREQAKKTSSEAFRVHRPYQHESKLPLSSAPTQVFYTSTHGKNIRDEYVSDYRHSLLGLPRRSRSDVEQTRGSPQQEQLGGSTTSSPQHTGRKCTIKKLDPSVSTYLVEVTPPEDGQESTSDMVMAEEQILVSEILDHITAPSVRTSSSGAKISDQRPSIGLPSHTESLTRVRNAYAEAVAKRVLSKNLAREIDNMVQDMAGSRLLEQHTAAAQKEQKLLGRHSSTPSIPSADEVIVNTAMVSNQPPDHAASIYRQWLEKDTAFAEQTKKEEKAETMEAEAKLHGQATTATQIGTRASALEVPPSKKERAAYCGVCEGALPLEKACHSFLCFGRHDLANYSAAVPSESLSAFKLRIASDDDVKEVMLLPWKEEESTYTLSASTITRRMIYPNGFYVAVDAAKGNICGTASIILFDEEVAFCGFFHLLEGYTFKDLGLLLWNQMLHTTSGKNVYTVLPQDGSQELLLNYPFHVSTVSPIMFGPVRLTRNAYRRKVLTLNYKEKYFAALVSYDKHVFGFSRKRFLSSTLQEVGLDVKVATRNERNISGYGAVQKDHNGRPVLRWLLADDKDTAESLMHSILQLFGPEEEVEIVGAFYTRNAITRTLLDRVNICELRPWVLIYTRREPIYNYSRIAALTTV